VEADVIVYVLQHVHEHGAVDARGWDPIQIGADDDATVGGALG
jgi:hypothetical protein